MLIRARSTDGAIDSVPVFNVANGQSTMATVEWSGSERATIRFAEAVISAEVGEDGRLLGLTARGQPGRVIRQDAFARMPIEEVDYGAPEGAPYSAEDVIVRTAGPACRFVGR